MTEWLGEFVLARLKPIDVEADLEFAGRFGIEEFPRILLLDPEGTKKIGECGDEPPEDVAATLRKALGR